MTARSPSAFLVAALLHGIVAALILLFTYLLHQQVKEVPQIIELVAGPGDNFAATEAPAKGTPTAVELNIPAPVPVPPQPVVTEPVPIVPIPEPVVQRPPPPKVEPMPKPVEKPVKQPAPPKPKAEPVKETPKMTKADFDRLNPQNKTKPAPQPKPVEVRKINAKGIAEGVLQSSSNTKDGAGGTATHRTSGNELDAYFALLKKRLLEAIVKPPGLGDRLVARAQVHVAASGALSGARIVSSSGSPEFDRAVLDAFARTRMPPRPDGKSEDVTMDFRIQDVR